MPATMSAGTLTLTLTLTSTLTLTLTLTPNLNLTLTLTLTPTLTLTQVECLQHRLQANTRLALILTIAPSKMKDIPELGQAYGL